MNKLGSSLHRTHDIKLHLLNLVINQWSLKKSNKTGWFRESRHIQLRYSVGWEESPRWKATYYMLLIRAGSTKGPDWAPRGCTQLGFENPKVWWLHSPILIVPSSTRSLYRSVHRGDEATAGFESAITWETSGFFLPHLCYDSVPKTRGRMVIQLYHTTMKWTTRGLKKTCTHHQTLFLTG